MNKNILFVCKHNRFRSKVAEAFFKKYNKNKKYFAMSAGLLPGRYPLDKEQVKIAREFGINIHGKTKPITMDLLIKTRIMVFVADIVPVEIFGKAKYKRKEYIWKIKDSVNNRDEDIREIISEIKSKIIEFVESLK